ncbi:patatin-like phospholipase family protein [Draconibacterium sp.]|nr:patatin-like phospholipase family protein [Draconibacterium sp.]MDC6485177.1 patatin-like phospholipase family protein [Luminiphilus sp.]
MSSKTISLVLGSGGARGLAHVGVIRWLEEHGHEIKSISGCSIGSFIGGAYATGKLDAIVDWMENFSKKEIYSMLDLSFSMNSLVKGDRLADAIRSKIGTDLIEDLPVKFTAVAADIAAEKEHWFQSGPVDQAIRASVSLPLFFTPHTVDGVQLIDGGILNPTPIEPTLADDTDLTVAVDLGGPMMKQAIPEPEKAQSPWHQKMDDFLESMKFSESKPKDQWDMFYIADQSFNTMQNAIARERMADNPPDHLIAVPRNKCGTLEFDRSAEMIEYGYQLAEKQLSGKI